MLWGLSAGVCRLFSLFLRTMPSRLHRPANRCVCERCCETSCSHTPFTHLVVPQMPQIGQMLTVFFLYFGSKRLIALKSPSKPLETGFIFISYNAGLRRSNAGLRCSNATLRSSNGIWQNERSERYVKDVSFTTTHCAAGN